MKGFLITAKMQSKLYAFNIMSALMKKSIALV